jgi:hypothetical protein
LNCFEIQPLNYALGIQDCLGLVGHRDVLEDPGFANIFKQIVSCLRTGVDVKGNGKGIHWLA